MCACVCVEKGGLGGEQASERATERERERRRERERDRQTDRDRDSEAERGRPTVAAEQVVSHIDESMD